MTASLEELFDRFRATGDTECLGEVFDRTAPRLLRAALHLARDPSQAEDALQGCYLTSIERAGDYDVSRPLEPWLLGILTNHVARLRDQSRRHAATGIASNDPLPEPAGDPVAAAERQELRETLRGHIVGLPEAYRQVLLLRLLHDMEHAEIAEVLGLAPGTVRMRVHRGLAQLRGRLPAGVAGMLAVVFGRDLLATSGTASIREAVIEGAVKHFAPPAAAAAPIAQATQATAAAQASASTAGWSWTPATIAGGSTLFLSLAAVGLWAALGSEPATPNGASSHRWAPATAAPPVAAVVDSRPSVSRSLAAPAASGAAGRGTTDRAPLSLFSTDPFAAPPPADLTVHVVDALGRPAPGVGLTVIPRTGGVEPALSRRIQTTDARGDALFAGLPQGMVHVSADRSSAEGLAEGLMVELRADAGSSAGSRDGTPHTTVQLQLDPGVTVRGRVVDPAGAPVPFAQLLLGETRGDGVTLPAQQADAHGHFALYGLQAERHILSARAPIGTGSDASPWASARAVLVAGRQGQTQDVVLTLRPGGTAVLGQVVDPTGQPLAGAVVFAEFPHWASRAPATQGPPRHMPPVRVVTASDGAFAIPGQVALRPLDLTFRAVGCAPLTISVTPRAGAHRLDPVALKAGGTVFGQVHNAAGEPVPNASVRLGDASPLSGGITRTDGDGRFALHGIAPGGREVFADHAEYGAAAWRFEATAEPVQWNPVLEPRPGRGPVGSPSSGPGPSRSPGPEHRPGSIGKPGPGPGRRAGPTAAFGTELRGTAPRGYRTVVLQQLATAEGHRVPRELPFHRGSPRDDGTFSWTNLPPGTWSLWLPSPDQDAPPIRRDLVLTADAPLDLGPLLQDTPPPGILHVALSLPDGTQPIQAGATVRDASGAVVCEFALEAPGAAAEATHRAATTAGTQLPTGATVAYQALLPGTYTVTLHSTNSAWHLLQATVRSGQPTVLRHVAQPASLRVLIPVAPDDRTAFASTPRLVLRDATGAVIVERVRRAGPRRGVGGQVEGPEPLSIALPPGGPYVLEAQRADGTMARGVFSVGGLEPEARTHWVELR